MYTRISRLAFASIALLSACAPEDGAPGGVSIECALGEGAAFASDCVLERAADDVFVIHHPDGAFYRFRFLGEGSEAVIAYGAEPVVEFRVQGPALGSNDEAGGVIEFATREHRYRFGLDLIASSTP
ncbi:MAG: hypothetical protein QNI87_04955 [Erythrobacter sp.]|uniref:hypothetical protein n=1 Tax=Erythrobacter sp. TaxID=1042 RepID=UPI00262FE025|nr:hypothetical protein [Erythrobacter sp.]MDJ0977865.1 hypothetical protein [Erythrobacter sp.]